MNVREIIAWNLRTRRVALGLSQEEMALRAGIDRAYVGRVERAKENITVATLEALAIVLDIHVGQLFAPVPPDAAPSPRLPAGRKSKVTRTGRQK